MNIKAIIVAEHASIMEVSEILSAVNHGGMQLYKVQHPELGKVAVIQGHGDGAILISMPE